MPAALSILVVDDDAECRALYRLFLGQHHLDIVDSYPEAIELLKATPRHVVISEAGILRPEGQEFLDHLRKLPGVKAVIHSQQPSGGELGRTDLWLIKPAWDRLRDYADRLSQKKGGIRREARKRVRLRAFAWCGSWESLHRVSTIDVSPHGVAFEADEPVEMGDAVKLSVAGHGESRVRLDGEVRYVRPLPQPGQWRIGLSLKVPPAKPPTAWYDALLGGNDASSSASTGI